MNDSLDLHDLVGHGRGDDGARRDRWGRYSVVDDAGELVGLTRVTTLAKALDDGGGLGPWNAAMTLGGFLADAKLAKAARAHWREHDGDPWYASAAAKTETKRLVKELGVVGGSKKAADEGTQLHRWFALTNLGRQVTGLTERDELWLNGVVNALIAAGISVDPAFVECMVVNLTLGYAGTADCLRVVHDGVAKTADLKTGNDLGYSSLAIAIQLAAYPGAEYVYEQGLAADGSDDVRHPMPEVSRTEALVIHAPALRPGEVTIYTVDIVAGWLALQAAIEARQLRKAGDDLLQVVWGPDLTDVFATATAAALELRERTTAEADMLSDARIAEHRCEVRAWLQTRIDAIGADAAPRRTLYELWPDGVAPLSRRDDHTDDELTLIERAVERVESRYSFPFGPPRPTLEPPPTRQWLLRRIGATFPGSTVEPVPTTQE